MPWNDALDPTSVAYGIASATQTRVRVIAGPGTGKSFAMKRRVARLLEAGVAPGTILAVTFTRVAAEDLHRELQQLGSPGCEQLQGQTLHSLAMRILSRNHILQALGRTPRPLNRFEIRPLLCDLALTNGGLRNVRKLLAGYEAAWARGQGDTPGYPATSEDKQFQQHIVNWLTFHRCMLIGELIPHLCRFLRENPGSAEHVEFQHLLIDEYQDLNQAEQTALRYLGHAGHMCIVGDDDQSIYGFKYAQPDGIRTWAAMNPGCADLAMSECHRCPTTVVAMANALIASNSNRIPKTLQPNADKGAGQVSITQLANLESESAWIAEKIVTLLATGVQPSEIIVLVQRSVVATPILAALRDANVPVKSYYDENQLESADAQTRFAYFKLVLDQEDRVALRYLLGVEASDFLTKQYARLRSYCESSGVSPWIALEMLASGDLHLQFTSSLVSSFIVIRTLRDSYKALEGNLTAFVDALLPPNIPELADLRTLAIDKLSTVDDCLGLYRAMLREISQPDVPLTIESVRLMSLHKSKGLSSHFVFIAGCVQGILPQLAAASTPPSVAAAHLEEARRLFYVGITRTKASPSADRAGCLYITYPRQMLATQAYGANVTFSSKTGTMANLIPSQFIAELGTYAPAPTAE